jgi:uncharacterized membrane protein YeaQ/YmgE (transglycosylase-associated protein family)
VFATFTAAYAFLGQEGAFRPGSYQVSGTWILLSCVLGFVAAAVGGLVCNEIAPGNRAPAALGLVVLVLGLLLAIPMVIASGDPVPERQGVVGNLEAMNSAREPAWIALLNPVLGAVGVLVGSRLLRRRGGQPAP